MDLFASAKIFKIAVFADFLIVCTMVKILFENTLHRIIESCHRTLNRCFGVGERNDWNTVFFACIVKIHPADSLSGSLLHQISVDIQLPTILLQLLA